MNGIFLEEMLIYRMEYYTLSSEAKKEYKKLLIKYLIDSMYRNCGVYVHEEDIELIRDSYNIRLKTVEGERIGFFFNMYDYTCRIAYQGKFEICIKLNREKIDKYRNKVS